jgi:UDP-N-acetylglucosamine 1-carboxyvinyltransferase
MDKMRIRGGKPLQGKIRISGAKNAALPLMTAALLTDETLELSNVPKLADITTMAALLGQHGVELNGHKKRSVDGGRTVELRAVTITNTTAPYDIVRKMRASILVLGPLMARCREARVSLPGGCAIGTRPVNLHIDALAAMGADIEVSNGYILADAPEGLHGAEIVFPCVTVTGTENILMAATLAQGETTIINAAREPEIADLAQCLVKMGAEIEGIGTDRLHVRGKDKLHGASHAVISDRIEAGTFAMAAAITNGDMELIGVRAEQLPTVIRVLEEAGVRITPTADGLRVRRTGGALQGVDITTEPFPGFPTDLQAQVMALMCVAGGASMITETIFENRFMHVPELVRMGADISVHNASAMIRGVPALKGAPVMATDLRASVSLVLAGLAAEGETIINRLYHLDRGYERLEEKLGACGAEIERVR